MMWQPISTAPRDRPILLYNGPKSRYRVFVGRWNDRLKQWQSEPGAWPCNPKLWAEVPEPRDG